MDQTVEKLHWLKSKTRFGWNQAANPEQKAINIFRDSHRERCQGEGFSVGSSPGQESLTLRHAISASLVARCHAAFRSIPLTRGRKPGVLAA
jgi:hypothetical protein